MVLPALFVSHGSPDLTLKPSASRDFLQQLGQRLPRPIAILVVSAHWNTQMPTVSTAAHPATIYDFGGFPSELYQLRYPALGAPALAERVVDLLAKAEIQSQVSADRGLDHGAWNPLLLMYPHADIPVTQLSIQPALDPAHHWAIGRALAPLRQEGVLVLASGTATHNLREFGGYSIGSIAPDWVNEFAQWLTQTIEQGDIAALLNYRKIAPYAQRNHPTAEHLLPLFVALGAGGAGTSGLALHESFTYGIFSMAAYAFGSQDSLSAACLEQTKLKML